MLDSLQKTVVDTNDEGLRHLTYEHLKVFAKFTIDNCEICKMLSPGFTKLADEDGYQDITFVRLDSSESPVAKHLMEERATPFFVSYCQGRIVECDTRATAADMREQLNRLRAFKPLS